MIIVWLDSSDPAPLVYIITPIVNRGGFSCDKGSFNTGTLIRCTRLVSTYLVKSALHILKSFGACIDRAASRHVYMES